MLALIQLYIQLNKYNRETWRRNKILNFGKEGRDYDLDDVNFAGPTLEPPLPRRKKCPELAYKTHEFITAADGGGIDAIDSNVVADKVRVRSVDIILITL